jgi:predicted KAP-like P-loop ATPase
MLSRILEQMRSLGGDLIDWFTKPFRTLPQPTTVDAPGSLDSPRLDALDDALNRHRISNEIYRIICNQTANHSVRIGLFGDWGYGKTTIAHWVGAMAEADNNIVVWFKPWSVRDLPELWLTFALTLRDALQRHKVTIPRWVEAKSTLGDVKRQ